MTRSINQLASVYHECLSVVYLLVCTHVYLSVCSTLCVLILKLSVCLSFYVCLRVCVSVGLYVCLSVSLDEIGQSVCRSISQYVGRSIGRSVYVPICVLLFVSMYLSLAVESALATKHPMAWLAGILSLLTSANRLIIELSLSLQHSALRITVVQPHRAPDRLLRQANPVVGLEPAAPGTTGNHPASQHERC
jgi:hypothetical protein